MESTTHKIALRRKNPATWVQRVLRVENDLRTMLDDCNTAAEAIAFSRMADNLGVALEEAGVDKREDWKIQVE